MNIQGATSDFKVQITKTENIETLENLRIKYLGRKGLINSFIEELKKVEIPNRKILGPKINNLKKYILFLFLILKRNGNILHSKHLICQKDILQEMILKLFF